MRGTYGLATPFGLNLPRARSREQSCNERAELVANEGEFRYHRSPLWYASDGVIRSIYRWEDRVHDQTEARVALHTRRALVSVIVGRARSTPPVCRSVCHRRAHRRRQPCLHQLGPPRNGQRDSGRVVATDVEAQDAPVTRRCWWDHRPRALSDLVVSRPPA
jgi:hypothetical protein